MSRITGKVITCISQHLITRTKAKSFEAHVNAIAASVLSQAGMQRLVDLPGYTGLSF